MPEGKDGEHNLPVYESEPPEWLPKTHASSDLGYPGFDPPRPGQDEDILSQKNVKEGFSIGTTVAAETFGARELVKSQFQEENALTALENLMNEVFVRRGEQPTVPSYTFRMPSRVTLNDAKRQAWFADLANPEVPLHKLGKNVPHGAKGHVLLDLLHSYNVAIPRAVWFLRVFGANETAGLRHKPMYNPTQYSVDWANVVTSYMKKQLGPIALPIAPRPGLNIKQTFKGLLADADLRERWISRFTYCLKLLRTFYSEGLVDNRTFLTWLVQQMGTSTSNLAQAGFVTRLADEYLDGLLGCRALMRPFIDACLARLVEIRGASEHDYLSHLGLLIRTILQRVCFAHPDAFVAPRTWNEHGPLLSSILTENIVDPMTTQPAEQKAKDLQQILWDNHSDIKSRNEAMTFRNLPPRALAGLGSAVSDIQLLNSIDSGTNLETFNFFDAEDASPPSFASKLDLLLTWSVTPLQYGDHRPYAAVTLLHLWRNRAEERATRRDTTSPDELVQDRLFDWLDGSEVAGDMSNLRSVAILFGSLVRHELFSYANYIQRLIARGEPGLSFTQEEGSRHRHFLRWIPLHKSTSSLISQRKFTLHGIRVRETPEDLNEREIRKEVRAILPDLFGGEASTEHYSPASLVSSCPALISASRFEQVRVFRQWLLPQFRKHTTIRGPEASDHASLLMSYSVIAEILAHTKCYGSLLDLNLIVLEHSPSHDLLTAVIDSFHLYLPVYSGMNILGRITTALYAAHVAWRSGGTQLRPLLALLMEVDNGRQLDAVAREHVSADISSFTHALYPETSNPDEVPARMAAILLLADDPSPNAPSILANSLWYKYRTAFDWAEKVWDNAVASLRQVPVMTSDPAGRRACALRYGLFLYHVDQHLPGGLDDHVLRWFDGPGKNEIRTLNADAWDVLNVVLVYLCVHGALATTTILHGLVFPTWELGADAAEAQRIELMEISLRAANALFECLMLQEESRSDGIPPTGLLDIRRIRCRRRDVYREPHFSALAKTIPVLVFIENNEHIAEDLRQSASRIKSAMCRNEDFRQGTYRNLDAVRIAFEKLLMSPTMSDSLCEPLIDALRLILSDPHGTLSDFGLSNWQDIPSLLGPWKLAATAIELQFVLRQIGRAMLQDATRSSASDSLDKLVFGIFRHSMTSEEAYFVAEMARGVDTPVAGKFINNGLQCVYEMLETLSMPIDCKVLLDYLERTGELLRVLAHVAEPLRDGKDQLPSLDPQIQIRFMTLLLAKFEILESILSLEGAADNMDVDGAPLPISDAVILLTRLLQFDLGFPGVWTKETEVCGNSLVAVLFRLVLLFSSGDKLDVVLYPLLIDTLYYLIDELPQPSKGVVFDPFRNYPDFPYPCIPSDAPPSYVGPLRALLAHFSPSPTVANLSTAHRDATSGNLVLGVPVVNRPWEWIENIGEPITAQDQEAHTQHPIRNASSLSLELFGARATGDGIVDAQLYQFEDGLNAESMFKRDWRETRIEPDGAWHGVDSAGAHDREEEADELGQMPTFAGQRGMDSRSKPGSRRVSPASSVRSRASGSGGTGSMRPSPSQNSSSRPAATNSTVSEPMGAESKGSSGKRSAAKRKAAMDDSDDEVEIVEGPIPAPAGRSSKKAKPTASKTIKARAKKK